MRPLKGNYDKIGKDCATCMMAHKGSCKFWYCRRDWLKDMIKWQKENGQELFYGAHGVGEIHNYG